MDTVECLDGEDELGGRIVDYVDSSYSSECRRIPLKTPIDCQQLMGQGTVFELHPEMDEELKRVDEETKMEYFSRLGEESVINEVLGQEDGEVRECLGALFDEKEAKMNDIAGDGSVKKKLLKAGLVSEGRPPARAAVTIEYSLYTEGADSPFDSSVIRGRKERYLLDDDQIIVGLEIAIKSMNMKERSLFMLSPKVAYGTVGCPPRIPPNAKILADVQLVEFVQESETAAILALPPEERSKKYNFEEVAQIARRELKEGNRYVSASGFNDTKEWKLAARRYQWASQLLLEAKMGNGEEEQEQKRLLLRSYLNLAQCYLNMPDRQDMFAKKACIMCRNAFEIDPRSVKAHYRMGKAQFKLSSYKDAKRYFNQALRIMPDCKEVQAMMARTQRAIRDAEHNEKLLCRRMIGNDGDSSDIGNRKEGPPPDGGPDFDLLIEKLEDFRSSRRNVMLLPPDLDQEFLQSVEVAARHLGGLKLEASLAAKGQWQVAKEAAP